MHTRGRSTTRKESVNIDNSRNQPRQPRLLTLLQQHQMAHPPVSLGSLSGPRPSTRRPTDPTIMISPTSVNNPGHVLLELGDLEGARPHLERAWPSTRRPTDPTVRVNNLERVLLELGDIEGARPHLERALAIRWGARRRLSDPRGGYGPWASASPRSTGRPTDPTIMMSLRMSTTSGARFTTWATGVRRWKSGNVADPLESGKHGSSDVLSVAIMGNNAESISQEII